MRVYQTPGVYPERGDAAAGGVAALRMDVTALVGLAERGPLHLAVPVESYRQFTAWFGGPIDGGYLAYSARGFFENGGRRLWVVRVASAAASAAALELGDALGPAWRVEASSAGQWGNALALRAVEVRAQRVHARLDPLDPRRLRVSTLAGFERHALLELVRGADRARAVVEALEPGEGGEAALRLAAPPVPALPAGAPALRVETLAVTLEVFAQGRLAAVFPALSLVPLHPRYGPRVLAQPWRTVDALAPEREALRVPEADLAADYFRIARGEPASPPPPVVIRELRGAARREALLPLQGLAGAAPSLPQPLRGGSDGLAALDVPDFTGEQTFPAADPELRAAARRGIAALDVVDEIGLVAVPDIHIRPDPLPWRLPSPCVSDPCLPGPDPLPQPVVPQPELPPVFGPPDIERVQAALVAHCERRRDRFALLDAPLHTVAHAGFTAAGLRDWRSRFDSRFAALYAPWLAVVDLRRPQSARVPTRAIPPSGHVAGRMAATDLRQGVHVPPANLALEWVQDVLLRIDEERHGLLNSLGVNVIRAVEGRGVRLLGARTLSSDADWRYVNVRRLVTMVAKALDGALGWAVFEPNDWRTRAKLSLVIGSFLRSLWQRGALVGATPEEGFFLRCDEDNNPPALRERGELHIDIGLAPVTPFEFIVLRIGRDANGFALREAEGA